MGLLAHDLAPLSATGPTTLIPLSRDVQVKVFSVSRTDTTNSVKVVLPAGSSVLEVIKNGNTNSNAGTTATVTVTIEDNSGVISSGTPVDVRTAGTTTGHVQMPNLPNLQPLPLNGDLRIKAVYAETGTASDTGGPWIFQVRYVR